MGKGGLDVPGRGSDTKTLKEEGDRSVCGTDIKLVWLELRTEVKALSRAYICTLVHLCEEGKMIGLK